MDRSQKIQSIVNKYGEENFYVSFSGGKDSTVLSWLVDYALPDNKIPRVFADTGIELKMVRDFALSNVTTDERFVAIKPSVPITAMLKEEGYPFKSKAHAKWVWQYQTKGMRQPIHNYLHDDQRVVTSVRDMVTITVSIMTDRGAIGTFHKEQLRKTGERVSMVIPDRAQNTWTVGTN